MRSLVIAPLLKDLALIGLGLVFFGVVGKVFVWSTLGLWVVWRIHQLWLEGRRPVMTEEDWTRHREAVTEVMEALRSEDPEIMALSAVEWDEKRRELIGQFLKHVAEARSAYVPPRATAVRVAEAIGCVGFLILLPWMMELAGNDIVSLRRSYGMAAAGCFALCVVLYAFPLLRRFRRWRVAGFWIWWVAPTLVLVPVAAHLLQNRHPYLDPLNPQRVRLAAEKVLNHPDFIVASDHADWVVDYARELAGKGEKERAVELCREALRMNPSLRDAGELLGALIGEAEEHVNTESVYSPYVEEGTEIQVMPRCEIEDAVVGVPNCTVLLIPMGEVASALLDYVAFVLQRETGLRTKVYGKTLPLPEATRKQGLLSGPQWDAWSLAEVMSAETSGRQVGGRLQILIVTNADIYHGNANFLFSANYEWGSVVSIARMSEMANAPILKHRVAKLSYGSLIKSLGVPASGDWRCVTSYSASVRAFDAKGNRPVPSTQHLLDAAIERVNREWLERARRGG